MINQDVTTTPEYKALLAELESTKALVDPLIQERHAQRVASVLKLKQRVGLAKPVDPEEQKRLAALDDSTLATLESTFASVAERMAAMKGSPIEFNGEQAASVEEDVREHYFGFRRDAKQVDPTFPVLGAIVRRT